MKTPIYGLIIAAIGAMSILPFSANAADKPVAIVNGKPISQKTYNIFLRNLQQQQPQLAGNRQMLINELISRELLYQDAKKKKLDKDEDVAFTLKQLQKNALIQANLAHIAKKKPITDAMLKKEYDEKITGTTLMEYKARHVLVKTEDEAKAIIKELDKGAVFSDVANAKTIEPNSNGGDLGWFKAGQMVPPFAAAVQKMKKGSYSKKPVKTRFGWHVIKLEDTRKAKPPKFEDVKGQIRQVLRSQQLQEYIEQLRKKAKIEIK